MEYLIGGLKPAISKQANDFMKACDLGGDGAFIATTETVEMNVKSGNIDKIPDILKKAYEHKLGWRDVVVQLI